MFWCDFFLLASSAPLRGVKDEILRCTRAEYQRVKEGGDSPLSPSLRQTRPLPAKRGASAKRLHFGNGSWLCRHSTIPTSHRRRRVCYSRRNRHFFVIEESIWGNMKDFSIFAMQASFCYRCWSAIGWLQRDRQVTTIQQKSIVMGGNNSCSTVQKERAIFAVCRLRIGIDRRFSCRDFLGNWIFDEFSTFK